MYELLKQRPALDKNLNGKTFRRFYWLKSELSDFCKQIGLCSYGTKAELTDRVVYYLDTGNVRGESSDKRNTKSRPKKVNLRTVIEDNFVCSEAHRIFFLTHLGNTFKFNAEFLQWLKNNAGKTYKNALSAYRRMQVRKKTTKTGSDESPERDTYIRDFFADNEGRTLDEAIRCRKYKESLAGHNCYEKSDLTALT